MAESTVDQIPNYLCFYSFCLTYHNVTFNAFISTASKPTNIHWIRIGSQFLGTTKLCIARCYRHAYQNKNLRINTSFVSPDLWPFWADKTDFNLFIFYFNIPKSWLNTMQQITIFVLFIKRYSTDIITWYHLYRFFYFYRLPCSMSWLRISRVLFSSSFSSVSEIFSSRSLSSSSYFIKIRILHSSTTEHSQSTMPQYVDLFQQLKEAYFKF